MASASVLNVQRAAKCVRVTQAPIHALAAGRAVAMGGIANEGNRPLMQTSGKLVVHLEPGAPQHLADARGGPGPCALMTRTTMIRRGESASTQPLALNAYRPASVLTRLLEQVFSHIDPDKGHFDVLSPSTLRPAASGK